MDIDYYKILDIKFSATLEEIKIAYKKQANIWHPDKTNYDTSQKMKLINEAKEILLNPEKKTIYDIWYLENIIKSKVNNNNSLNTEKIITKNKKSRKKYLIIFIPISIILLYNIKNLDNYRWIDKRIENSQIYDNDVLEYSEDEYVEYEEMSSQNVSIPLTDNELNNIFLQNAYLNINDYNCNISNYNGVAEENYNDFYNYCLNKNIYFAFKNKKIDYVNFLGSKSHIIDDDIMPRKATQCYNFKNINISELKIDINQEEGFITNLSSNYLLNNYIIQENTNFSTTEELPELHYEFNFSDNLYGESFICYKNKITFNNVNYYFINLKQKYNVICFIFTRDSSNVLIELYRETSENEGFFYITPIPFCINNYPIFTSCIGHCQTDFIYCHYILVANSEGKFKLLDNYYKK